MKEVKYLSMIKDKPSKPFIVVLGGVKVNNKMGALEICSLRPTECC
jgi:phosphoglycerate kinase